MFENFSAFASAQKKSESDLNFCKFKAPEQKVAKQCTATQLLSYAQIVHNCFCERELCKSSTMRITPLDLNIPVFTSVLPFLFGLVCVGRRGCGCPLPRAFSPTNNLRHFSIVRAQSKMSCVKLLQ